MTNSFWEGGAAAYAEGLKEEYQARRAELYSQLAERFDLLRRAEIEEEIAKLKSDYRAKCRAASQNIH